MKYKELLALGSVSTLLSRASLLRALPCGLMRCNTEVLANHTKYTFVYLCLIIKYICLYEYIIKIMYIVVRNIKK